MLQEILSILEFVHSHGLIHRDIKPSNIIRREDERLVLIDFGSVKQAWTQVVTMQGQTISTFAIGLPATIIIGTPGYMPTEQRRGRPRLNSDIYALGMIAIQALTGLNPTQLPEDLDTSEIIWEDQAQVSADLASVLNKMVCYHFKERYQEAKEVLLALQPLANLYPPIKHSTNRAGEVEEVSAPSTLTTLTTPSLEAPETPLPAPHVPVSSRNKSALLVDLAIGVIAALALAIGIYYSVRSPAPASNIQKYPVSIPLKGNSLPALD